MSRYLQLNRGQWCSHSAIELVEGLWAGARASELIKPASWQELYEPMGNEPWEGSQGNDDIAWLHVGRRKDQQERENLPQKNDVAVGNSGSGTVVQTDVDVESNTETALAVVF